MSGRGVIAVEPPQDCQACGVHAECRPYGANGEQLCFECAMKDPEMAKRRMLQHVFGIGFDS